MARLLEYSIYLDGAKQHLTTYIPCARHWVYLEDTDETDLDPVTGR